VIYFAGQTHVGMYVGDGLVIHAPRPGSVVQFAEVDAMPIDKIVRPGGA
jgi:cell wall-associated NlpC family hydrolase